MTNVAAAQTDVATLVERAVAYVERFQQQLRVGRFGRALRAAAPSHRGSGEHERAAAWRRRAAGNDARFRLSARRGEGRGLAAVPRRLRARRQTGSRSRRASRLDVPEGRTQRVRSGARRHGRRGALQHRQHQPEHQHADAHVGVSHRAPSPAFRVQAGKARRLRSGHRDRISRRRVVRRSSPRPAGAICR